MAQARAALIEEGLLQPSRKAPLPPTQKEPPKPARGLLDHEAMQAMADIVDAELAGLDDEAIFRRLAKQCLSFALNPKLHPDTRMSASQVYFKLKERQREQKIGPGNPLTYEDAVARGRDINAACGWRVAVGAMRAAFPTCLRDMMVACGPAETLAAVNEAFDVKEVPGEDVQAPPAGGATPPAGAA